MVREWHRVKRLGIGGIFFSQLTMRRQQSFAFVTIPELQEQKYLYAL